MKQLLPINSCYAQLRNMQAASFLQQNLVLNPGKGM